MRFNLLVLTVLIFYGQRIHAHFVARGQINVTCGHRKGDGLFGKIRIWELTIRFPMGKGFAVLLGCRDFDLFARSACLKYVAVHKYEELLGGNLVILRGQGNILRRHLKGDGLAGDVHITRQASCFPMVKGAAFLLRCFDANLFIHSVLRSFGSLASLVVHSYGKGRLFGGFVGLVYHNRRAVILDAKSQSFAVCIKGSARIIVDRLAVDVLDRLTEGKHHTDIANAVNSGCFCHGNAADLGHNTVHVTQLALLLTGDKVCVVDAAKAHRIGNSSLAVVTRQAAHDHGIPDDRCLRCIAGQNDILEHAAGDLRIISQFDRRVEHAAVDGAGLVEGDFPLEVSAFNNGVIEFDRSIGIHIGNRHVLQRNAIALQRCLSGVDFPRVQVHRVAVRAGDKDHRLGSVLAECSGVLPAQALIEGDLHAPVGHFLGLHAGQVGQTLTGNAQGLDRADIGRLVHQNILAVVVTGDMQYPALGRGIFIVVAELFIIVDADHIGVQRDICSACAHQIDGIGGRGQFSACYCSHIAVAHGQLAELLPGCQCSFNIVRPLAKHGIRNGKLAFTEKGSESAVQNNCIGNSAFACAGQGVKGTAGNFNLAGVACRVDANTSIRIDAAGDLTAGKHQSALFAKRCVSNGSIGQLNRAVDGCRAQLFEVDFSAALICHCQNAPRIRDVGIAGIGPAAAQVGFKLIFALVQAFHAGHIGQVGQTLTGKAQFLAHGRDLNQLHGCVARHRDHADAGRECCAVCADGD